MLIAKCCMLLVSLALLAGRDRDGTAAAAEAARQTISVQPEPKYFVAAGQQVKLPCHVASRQGDCAWLGVGGRIVSPSGRKYVFARSPADGDCSLLIRNASVQADDGQWQCQALAPEGEIDLLQQSRVTQLVVLLPPDRPQIKDLSQRPNRLILEEKKEKNITCEIRGGNPAPQIEWYLDGKPMNQHAQMIEQKRAEEQRPQLVQSRLLLNAVKRSMNGKNLTCVGVHPTQNQSTSIELDVQYVPSTSLAQKELTLVEGSPLTVPCLVDANPPASHISWRFVNADSNGPKGEAIMTTNAGPVLEVNQVSRAYNRVQYECLAQNSLGISKPAEMRLNVLYPPRAINATEPGHVGIGQPKLLNCVFDGNPQPEIKWFYQDPLSRSAASAVVDNSKDWDGRAKSLAEQQFLNIRNVTYRSEGEYVCEARNTINGQTNTVRSIPMNLDVYGEPQFLVKSPLYAKVVQGSKSDISLTFCSDPQPMKIYWQFGSIRLEVKLPTNSELRVPSGVQNQLNGRHQPALSSRYQAQVLQPLHKRDTVFSRPSTCFEAVLTLYEPEMSDQRDYTLFVHNEQGSSSGFVRVRVTSPLSPALMITSAFVFICGLFLSSLLFLFIFKKRQQFISGARRANDGSVHSSQANGSNGTASSGRRTGGRKDKNLLVGQEAANGLGGAGGKSVPANGQLNGHHQQQTKGVVSGAANGLANGAANLAGAGLDDPQATGKGSAHGLMSMASSDTSCNDQKQLLASNLSDRNSSVGGDSASSAALDVGAPADHYHHHHNNGNGGSTDRSTASSSPSQLNHISVDDELNLNGTYQATEPITRGARLSPPGPSAGAAHYLNGQSALIYANIDYNDLARRRATGEDQSRGGDQQPEVDSNYNGHLGGRRSDLRTSQQQSPEASTIALSKMSTSSAGNRRRQQTPQLSPNGSTSTVQENFGSQQEHRAGGFESASPPLGTGSRPSVGATIALMNSLAAAQSAAASVSSPANSATSGQTPNAGALNGAISQQLMANSASRARKPGPPKPPKPSIQQRSRFYQQQQQANNGLGLVMIGDSQMGTYPVTSGDHAHKTELDDLGAADGSSDLAAEYSRLAFPARAEL